MLTQNLNMIKIALNFSKVPFWVLGILPFQILFLEIVED